MRNALARRAALSWSRSTDLTPQRLWPVLREKGGLESLLSCGEGELAERLGSAARARAVLRSAEDTRADRWALEVERRGVKVVTAFDEEFPSALNEIPDPPFLLFALGSLDRLRLPAIAVVGSRAATAYGRDVASRLGRDLSSVGIAVVSGFARGVDAAAHEAALDGPGGTIAVLGCGLDVDYPRENARLKESVVRQGLLLSEFPPGTEPRAQNFPIRNRIIAGLVSGVVVVEASRRSGSLITARLAADFGRDVFAVPGSVFSETSVGAHELLRDGAILCRGAPDVFAELFPALEVRPDETSAAVLLPAQASPEARALFAELRSEEALSPDELALRTHLSAATVLAALFELEASGVAAQIETGRYRLAGFGPSR